MNIPRNLIWNYNLFPESGLADPHAIVEGDRVYLFCGHDQSWNTEHTWVMDKWVIISSDNLIDWRIESEILPTDTYIGDLPNCWAGFISKKKNTSIGTSLIVILIQVLWYPRILLGLSKMS